MDTAAVADLQGHDHAAGDGYRLSNVYADADADIGADVDAISGAAMNGDELLHVGRMVLSYTITCAICERQLVVLAGKWRGRGAKFVPEEPESRSYARRKGWWQQPKKGLWLCPECRELPMVERQAVFRIIWRRLRDWAKPRMPREVLGL